MARLVIRNERELLSAMKRADQLKEAPDDSVSARESEQIAEAIRRYDETIAMMTGVADKAAGETSDDVAGISGAE